VQQLAQTASAAIPGSPWWGTSKTIADEIEEWLFTEGSDGFNRDVPLLAGAGALRISSRTSFPELQAPQPASARTTKGDDGCANISACRAPRKNRFLSVILGAHRDNAQRRRGGLTLSFYPFDTAYRRGLLICCS